MALSDARFATEHGDLDIGDGLIPLISRATGRCKPCKGKGKLRLRHEGPGMLTGGSLDDDLQMGEAG